MGVFDFVKEAGAKIGIGDTKEEKAQAASEEAAKEAAVREKKRRTAKVKRDAQIKKSADVKAKAVAEDKAEAAEARAASQDKSDTMEVYLKSMGFGDLDVRLRGSVATVIGEVADQATREKIILALGNSQGIDQVRDYIKIAVEEPESEMYVVQRGDSLSKIAKEVYGDAMKYPAIFEANKPMLKDPDLIFPGQVLRIPAAN